MSKIVLISCVSQKQSKRSVASELYISKLFQKSLRYAESLQPDKIFILSAKYYLVGLEDVIDPYEVTLKYMSPKALAKKPRTKVLSALEKVAWGEQVLKQLTLECNIVEDEIIFLAGEDYVNPLMKRVGRKWQFPMHGMRIGQRLSFLGQV